MPYNLIGQQGPAGQSNEGYEYKYESPPGSGDNPGLEGTIQQDGSITGGGTNQDILWFRYDTGSYGTTTEKAGLPEGATFVGDLDEFKGKKEDYNLADFSNPTEVIGAASTGTKPDGNPINDDNDNATKNQTGNNAGNTALRQLPQSAIITKIGDEWRIVLPFSDGLGAAWYDITSTQYANLGNPKADETFADVEDFTNKYGDFYFGNLNEIEINGDVAWQEMTKSIFAEFGQYIPLDSPELKRLVLQAYFEQWEPQQVEAAYKNTSYYNAMSDQARAYEGMSDAEKLMEIERQQYKLNAHYIYEYGDNPTEGLDSFKEMATKIAKGEISIEGAFYTITSEAQNVQGSSANRRLTDELAQKNEALGADEANYSRILNSHNVYYGNHVPVDEGYYRELAKELTLNQTDWNSVLNQLQTGSAATHKGKDPTLTWNQYSSGAKSVLKAGLELNDVDNNDPLLVKILSGELQGKDVDTAIRADNRFLNTKRAEDEFTSSVNSIGSMLGFE